MTAMLRQLLRELDMTHVPPLSFDDLRDWPDGARPLYERLGIIREIEMAKALMLWECVEPRSIEPVFLADKQTGRMRGYVGCDHPECSRMHIIELERMRQWAIDLDGVAHAVAAAVGITHAPQVITNDRVYYLGPLVQEGIYREVFLCRGAWWPDAREVLAGADRLRSSPAPAVLTLRELPPPQAWAGTKPAVLCLRESVTMSRGLIELEMAPLFMQSASPHPQAVSAEWLTVTKAAELLARDLPGLTLEQAKARISAAASRGALKTNGQRREKRRVAADSLAAWRLAQRDKDLDAEDVEDEM